MCTRNQHGITLRNLDLNPKTPKSIKQSFAEYISARKSKMKISYRSIHILKSDSIPCGSGEQGVGVAGGAGRVVGGHPQLVLPARPQLVADPQTDRPQEFFNAAR